MELSPPAKKPRVLSSPPPSQGVRFAVSPVLVRREEAIAAKRQNPQHVNLRELSVHSLTVEEAAKHDGDDFLLCISPSGTSSNRRLDKLTSMESQFHLYFTLLGSSPKMCEVDLVQYLLRHLDYFLKRIVREEMRKNAHDFEEALLGPRRQRPFQSMDGNNLRYGALLQFSHRMQSLPMDANAASRLHIYLDLLGKCEGSLLQSLDKAGANYTQEEEKTLLDHIHAEILDFLTSETKGDRDVAAHIFCNLLWVETDGSLEELDLEEEHFPGLHHRAFDLSRPHIRETMAQRVLVLKDLHHKFESNKIGKFAHEVIKAAFKLVYSCIQRNVNASLKVTCGHMVAVIPGQRGGSEQDIVELDPPPSMGLLEGI